MTKRQKIARWVAKQAATAAYKSVMNAPMKKIATAFGSQYIAPSAKDVAKIAATSAYKAVLKLGQMALIPPDEAGVQGLAGALGFKNIADRVSGKNVPVTPTEVSQFVSAISSRYAPYGADQVGSFVDAVNAVLASHGVGTTAATGPAAARTRSEPTILGKTPVAPGAGGAAGAAAGAAAYEAGKNPRPPVYSGNAVPGSGTAEDWDPLNAALPGQPGRSLV